MYAARSVGVSRSSSRPTPSASASPRCAPSSGSALAAAGPARLTPPHVSRRDRADCMTLIASRVVVVTRNAAASRTWLRRALCQRTQTSCTMSSASAPLRSMRYAIPNRRGRTLRNAERPSSAQDVTGTAWLPSSGRERTRERCRAPRAVVIWTPVRGRGRHRRSRRRSNIDAVRSEEPAVVHGRVTTGCHIRPS